MYTFDPPHTSNRNKSRLGLALVLVLSTVALLGTRLVPSDALRRIDSADKELRAGDRLGVPTMFLPAVPVANRLSVLVGKKSRNGEFKALFQGTLVTSLLELIPSEKRFAGWSPKNPGPIIKPDQCKKKPEMRAYAEAAGYSLVAIPSTRLLGLDAETLHIRTDGRIISARRLGTDKTGTLSFLGVALADGTKRCDLKEGTFVMPYTPALYIPEKGDRPWVLIHRNVSKFSRPFQVASSQLDSSGLGALIDVSRTSDAEGDLVFITDNAQPKYRFVGFLQTVTPKANYARVISFRDIMNGARQIAAGLVDDSGGIGLGMRSVPSCCVVSKVLGGSAAERSGLKVGDRITSVHGLAATSFADVLVGIRSSKALLEIEVLRSGVPNTVKVSVAK
jgi:hypothetical protein